MALPNVKNVPARPPAHPTTPAAQATHDTQARINGLPPGDGPRTAVRVNLALAGPTGKVGRALLAVLEQKGPWLQLHRRIDLRIVGAINTRRMAWNEHGIDSRMLLSDLDAGEQAHWDPFVASIHRQSGSPLIFLDCTASPAIARQYLPLLEAGIAVVTPNKIANTLEYSYYHALRRAGNRGQARYLYETTVGAATPMLRTLSELRRTGDRIRRIEGVLSGTLSFVFNRVNEGDLFSDAVRSAVQLGFAEPDPANDLSGEDVARKLLILAREAGYPLERSDIRVNPLIPPVLGGIADPDEFLARLRPFDGEWTARAEEARRIGKRLTYLAAFDGTAASVGLAAVSGDHVFVRLQPSENVVCYTSDRHTPLPLTIQGIGAGPEVTARGVLADVIHTAMERAA